MIDAWDEHSAVCPDVNSGGGLLMKGVKKEVRVTEKEDSTSCVLHPGGLDVEMFADAPPHDRATLKAVASTIELERERLRPILGKGSYHARGLLRRTTDVVDSMGWEDLLLRSDVITRCAIDAGTKEPEIIKLVLTHCQPENYVAFGWMSACYLVAEKVEDKSWPLAVMVARATKTHLEQAAAKKRKELAKKGARAKNAVHEERSDAIRSAWASGIYANRDLCAEKEWERLGFETEDTARRRLQKTANPDPWPGKDM